MYLKSHSLQTLVNPNKVLINHKALEHNFHEIQAKHPEARICPVLKSNAYGHGLEVVAPLFDVLNTPFLVVNSLNEALRLEKVNVKTPILILGHIDSRNLKLRKFPFNYAVFNLETAAALNKHQPKSNVHIFVDTGMSREGVTIKDLPNFISEIKKLRNINISGLCSHFADADNKANLDFINTQINNFKKALTILSNNKIYPVWRHISASSGSYKITDKTFNMLRIGKALYGISPLDASDPFYRKLNLKPALKLVSTIAQIKYINMGDTVGYSRTYVANKKLKIALVPAGYFEGIDRRLSNIGWVSISGKYCQILGRVSMNMCVIDVSRITDAGVGQEVIIYSDQANAKNNIYNVAIQASTIPYDILVHIPDELERIVV